MLHDNAPDLPDFLRREYPFRRRTLTLAEGRHAGHDLVFVDEVLGHERDLPLEPSAGTVVLLHGNPTWGFLWRKVMRRLDGLRVVVPDLLGLGFSDKLRRVEDHSLEGHVEALAELARALDLRDALVVGQDWGGPMAMCLGARERSRFVGIVGANGTLALPEHPRSKAFHKFSRIPVLSRFVFQVLGFPLGWLHRVQNDPDTMRGAVARAHKYPLRRIKDRVAPLAMARMVPDSDDHPSLPEMRRGEAWVESLYADDPRRVSFVWGKNDPILGAALRRQSRRFPDAPLRKTEAGHFLQEEVPEEIADAILDMHAYLAEDDS